MKASPKAKPHSEEQQRESLYRSVALSLGQRLKEGEWAAGFKVPSLRALAKEFNVSTMTVNQCFRILHEDGLVNYIPAVGAFVRGDGNRNQAAAQTAIVFATINMDTIFSGRVATGIEETCRNRGWILQICNTDCKREIEAQMLDRVSTSGCKGAIMIVMGDPSNMEALFRLKLAGFPFVLVDRRILGLQVDVVESDHEKGAYLATKYLLSRGFRQVYMLSYPPGVLSSVDDRWRGYDRALIDHGIQPNWEWRVFCNEHPENQGAFSKWHDAALPVLRKLREKRAPVAFVTVNPAAARGLLDVCHNLNMSVPDDVSLVSFDDAEFLQGFHPPITVVAQRIRELGRQAFEMLDRRIQAGPGAEPQHLLLDMDLIERNSVRSIGDAVAGQHPSAQSMNGESVLSGCRQE